jgi:hypothetical protein
VTCFPIATVSRCQSLQAYVNAERLRKLPRPPVSPGAVRPAASNDAAQISIGLCQYSF